MRSLRLEGPDKLIVTETSDPVPKIGEAIVALRAAALNHRDLWIKKGQWCWGSVLQCCVAPMEPGSSSLTGIRGIRTGGQGVVIINLRRRAGVRMNGSRAPSFPSSDFLAGTGRRDQDCGSEDPVVSLKPAHLIVGGGRSASPRWAGLHGALFSPAGGLLRRRPGSSSRGSGGGVALFALRLAIAFGAETWVTSGSREKISWAERRSGPRGGFDYSKERLGRRGGQVFQALDLIIDSAGGEGFNDLV